MPKIEFLPSMVLDVICFMQKASLGDCNCEQWMESNQISEIKKLTAQLPSDFTDDCLGMSTLSLIISTATDNQLENSTLDDLIDIFKNTDSLVSKVKERITDGYIASYVYQMFDMLVNGYSLKYIEKLEQLKAIGFEEQYKKRILPLVAEEIKKNQSLTADYNCKELFEHIATLKCCKSIANAKIFISFFSAPVAFSLYKGAFLMCFTKGDYDFYTLTAHELMHGFADNELTEMYLQYTASDEYLREMHRRLIEEMCSAETKRNSQWRQSIICV